MLNKTSLRSKLRRHLRRWAIFSAVGVPMTGLGLALYYVEVSHLGMNEFAIRPANWVALTATNFVFNWMIWRDRSSPKIISGMKFYAVALFNSGISSSVFALLSVVAGLNYLMAQALTAALIGLMHYALNDRIVFTPSKTSTA